MAKHRQRVTLAGLLPVLTAVSLALAACGTDSGGSSGSSAISLSPNNTAVNGTRTEGWVHSGPLRSTSASGISTTPSTAGDAATMARLRARPVMDFVLRSCRTTSARGPCSGSANTAVGSTIGYREQPSDT